MGEVWECVDKHLHERVKQIIVGRIPFNMMVVVLIRRGGDLHVCGWYDMCVSTCMSLCHFFLLVLLAANMEAIYTVTA